jgi:ATP-binding cassette subfamily B protein
MEEGIDMSARLFSIGDKIRNALRVGRALKLVWNASPWLALTNSLLVIIQGLLPLAALYFMKKTVDAVSAGVIAEDKSAAFSDALLWIVLTASAALLIAIFRSIAEWTAEAQSQKVTDSVSDILHAQSIAVDLGYYEDPRYHDTLHLAQQQAPYRPARIVNGLLQIGQNSIALAGIVALLFSFNWVIALVLFAAAFPGAIARLKHIRNLYAYEERQAEIDRRAWYYHWTLTDPGYAKEIRLFGLGNLFKARSAGIRKDLREGRLALAAWRMKFDLAAQTGATLAIFGTFAYICYQTILGPVTLGGLVMYYLAFQSGLSFLQGVLRGMAGIYEDNLFLTAFYQFLDIKPKIQAPERPVPVPASINRGITFEDVYFRYPGSQFDALSGIDLTIVPGQVIALVGENGSGKTTLVKLLCRLYDPDHGKIRIDGTDIRMMDPVSLRKIISVIFQDHVRYDLSARENIWAGDIVLPQDSGRISLAAALTGADRVIKRLPEGYETILGPRFERGRELSTGEWQRIALARALFRDAQVAVLDEPTSSIDPQAETALFSRLRETLKGRSVVIISHRLSAVKSADRIYVMDRGRIIEQGTHEELLGEKGQYSAMYGASSALPGRLQP